jgi:hypothetical protein
MMPQGKDPTTAASVEGFACSVDPGPHMGRPFMKCQTNEITATMSNAWINPPATWNTTQPKIQQTTNTKKSARNMMSQHSSEPFSEVYRSAQRGIAALRIRHRAGIESASNRMR